MDDVTADLTSAWNIRAALDMLDPAELIRKAVNEKLDEAYRKARSMHPSKLTEHGNYGYVLAREEIADAILAMKEEG
jgi:Tfp pilus assembly protein PilF